MPEKQSNVSLYVTNENLSALQESDNAFIEGFTLIVLQYTVYDLKTNGIKVQYLLLISEFLIVSFLKSCIYFSFFVCVYMFMCSSI